MQPKGGCAMQQNSLLHNHRDDVFFKTSFVLTGLSDIYLSRCSLICSLIVLSFAIWTIYIVNTINDTFLFLRYIHTGKIRLDIWESTAHFLPVKFPSVFALSSLDKVALWLLFAIRLHQFHVSHFTVFFMLLLFIESTIWIVICVNCAASPHLVFSHLARINFMDANYFLLSSFVHFQRIFQNFFFFFIIHLMLARNV
jgi:hypothetical protein